MHIPGDTIQDRLASKGITRREFLKFCTFMAGALALPPSAGEDIARALNKAKRTPVVWLELQDCAGCSEAFLRASSPSAAEVILDLLSVDYQETIMAASGYLAEEAKEATIKAGGYILIVEGSISPADDGVYCCIGGKSSVQLLKEAAANAVAVIALGNCATFGGLPKANPNPTKAVGVIDIISDKPVLNLPGCPVNVVNLTATVVHYLTFNKLPEMDKLHRPLFGFGHLIHDNCERRGHFDAGQFVKKWGDEGHRLGWCLYQMGCKGPVSSHNCPSVRYNEGVSWPVGSGHGCIGCSEPGFWDWPTYQPVQVSAFTPPTTYPRIKEETQAITPGGAAISGGTVGAIIGAAAAFWYMSVTRRLSTKKESVELEPEELPETPKEESEP